MIKFDLHDNAAEDSMIMPLDYMTIPKLNKLIVVFEYQDGKYCMLLLKPEWSRCFISYLILIRICL